MFFYFKLSKFIREDYMLRRTLTILFFAFMAVFVSCPTDDLGGIIDGGNNNETNTLDWGSADHADVLTLGLTPGNDTTDLYLNWYSQGSVVGKLAIVRVAKDSFSTRDLLLQVDEADSSVNPATSGYTVHKAKNKIVNVLLNI